LIAKKKRIEVKLNGVTTALVTDAVLNRGPIQLVHTNKNTEIEFERIEIKLEPEGAER